MRFTVLLSARLRSRVDYLHSASKAVLPTGLAIVRPGKDVLATFGKALVMIVLNTRHEAINSSFYDIYVTARNGFCKIGCTYDFDNSRCKTDSAKRRDRKGENEQIRHTITSCLARNPPFLRMII